LSGAIHDQELVLEDKGFRNYGTDAAGPSKRARAAMKWIKRMTRLLIAESWQEGKSQGNMGETTIRQPQENYLFRVGQNASLNGGY
jgi:hypothetical protein